MRPALKIEEELDAAEHRTSPGRRYRNRSVHPRTDTGARRGAQGRHRPRFRSRRKATPPYRSANEGFMHACGHDAHAASLVGAARALKAQEKNFTGEVRIFFQQAERDRTGCAAIHRGWSSRRSRRDSRNARKLCPPDRQDRARVGTNQRLVRLFQDNRQGFAGPCLDAAPRNGRRVHRGENRRRSPNRSSHGIPTPLDSVVVGVGVIRGGTNYNIIANEAVIEGTTRSFTDATRELG